MHSLAFVWRSRQFRKDNSYRSSPQTLTVLTYPGRITRHPHILLAKLCAALGYTVTSDPTRPFDVAVDREFERRAFTVGGQAPGVTGDPVVLAAEMSLEPGAVGRRR